MTSEADRLEVRPLDDRHDRAAFSCGNAELDAYLRTQAGQNMRRGMAVAWVMSKPAAREIIGYYTLTNRDIVTGPIPEDVAAILKVSPRATHVPGILLGRFAIDERYRGRGFGTDMCMDALHRAYQVSRQSAAYGVLLHAGDDRAAGFWMRLDFVPLKTDDNGKDVYFMPMKRIRSIFE